MGKELYIAAAECSKAVYTDNIDIGTTEFNVFRREIKDKEFQILAIAGTNEKKDWLKNFNLLSKKGVKKSAYDSAKSIAKYCCKHRLIDYSLPIAVTGHSLGGAEAIAYHKIVNGAVFSNICIAFAPARCLRYWTNRTMIHTTIFTDPDDPVSFVGRISFGHPKCKHYKAENNYFGFKIDDHDMSHWLRYCQNIRE